MVTSALKKHLRVDYLATCEKGEWGRNRSVSAGGLTDYLC